MPLPAYRIGQFAYMVPDLRAGIDYWVRSMGVGPFFCFEHTRTHPEMRPQNPLYRGQAVDADISMAIAYSGGVQIELIQQHDDTPSIYKEAVDRRGYGYHHCWQIAPDFAAAVAAFDSAGCPAVWTGFMKGIGRYAYMDAVETTGGYIELLETPPHLLAMYARMEAAASNWDGADPVRPITAA